MQLLITGYKLKKDGTSPHTTVSYHVRFPQIQRTDSSVTCFRQKAANASQKQNSLPQKMLYLSQYLNSNSKLEEKRCDCHTTQTTYPDFYFSFCNASAFQLQKSTLAVPNNISQVSCSSIFLFHINICLIEVQITKDSQNDRQPNQEKG